MNKRFGSAMLAAASVASVVTVGSIAGASTASAATPCGTYPPGAQYVLVSYPRSAVIADDAVATTRGTLRRNGQACVGFRIGLYARSVPSTNSSYHLLPGSRNTDSTGSIRVYTKVAKGTVLRTYFNMNVGGGGNVMGSKGQLYSRSMYCRYVPASDPNC